MATRTPPTADLLFEIGTEELPWTVIRGTIAHLDGATRAAFERARLSTRSVQVYGTPRRLVVVAEGVAARQAEATTQVVGPPASAAFDAEGKPTRAAEGFAKSQNVAVADLTVVTTEKGRYVAVARSEERKAASAVLRELLPTLISGLSFPRAMKWEPGGARFARPIRWMVALFGGKSIPIRYGGVASGPMTRGHALSAPKPFRAPATWAAFSRALERRGVIVDHARRRSAIAEQLAEAARGAGGRLVEDDDLLEQAAFLTESPCAVAGAFDRRYLALPREVIVTVLKEHQGYFSLVDKKGEPLPAFIAVSNVKPAARAMAAIRAGYERVIRARLDDAKFYFDQDQKEALADRVVRLKGVVFQEKLGTVYEKVERLAARARQLAPRFEVDADQAERAARLCKADLTTGMVREFPELQGVMGREYARRQREPEAVAEAIGDHYRPRFAGDRLPAHPLAQLVAVADKVDTIVRCFGAGLIPTGSQDPYALRRQALGVVQILRERPVVTLSALIASGAQSGTDHGTILEFFCQRIESQAKAEGFRADLINAVLDVPSAADAPHVAFRRLAALTAFSRRPAFESLMTACKRVMNILPEPCPAAIDPARFTHDAERRLHAETQRAAAAVAVHEEQGRDEAVLETFESLKPAIDGFFTDVMVMADDPAVRDTRLALLKAVNDLLARFADFRAVATTETAR
ncbi:MAG TPA: glycine--tRNA ligase subunit beta [Nitrospiria bacterium]|nr:glycine--tRNA ligase subunit beta [Nitrospiria bacterium]